MRLRPGLYVLVALGVAVSWRSGAGALEPEDDFAPIVRVLQSPRCNNCHPAGDAPLVGDLGRPHRMNVTRASPAAGLPCTTCHREENVDRPHGPPGVPGWRMPAASMPMVFQGKSRRELCEQLKDPSRNGGKSLGDLEEHFASDPLVLWAYDPGPGRTLPPVAHDVLVGHVRRWIASGAPCPP